MNRRVNRLSTLGDVLPEGAQEVTINLDTLVLGKGSHDSPEDGACVMEAVAFIAGEPWSDHPQCASPVIGAFLRAWNDSLDDDDRQQLKAYIPRLVGTRGSQEQEDARAWMALDWLVRVYTPHWLRFSATTAPQYSSGLAAHAEILAGLPEFKAGMDVPSIRPAIQAARTDAAAAGDAARDAARDAATLSTTWTDTAGATARAAAGAAAGAAARAAAWDAARDAARDAAWAAAWAAAGAALAPAIPPMQQAAHELIERMLAVTEERKK